MAEVVYRALGSDGGTARSTQSGYEYAIRHFNIFLAKMGIDRKFTELLEDEICSVKLFQQFGTYLAEDARDRNDDFLIAKPQHVTTVVGLQQTAASTLHYSISCVFS